VGNEIFIKDEMQLIRQIGELTYPVIATPDHHLSSSSTEGFVKSVRDNRQKRKDKINIFFTLFSVKGEGSPSEA